MSDLVDGIESPETATPPARVFDRYRRTWELELLISGAVVFALFRLPGRLDHTMLSAELIMNGDQRFAAFMLLAYLKVILYVLIASFLVHLVGRAYWVGLIGLDAVFPGGVRWDELKDGPLVQAGYRQMPSLRQLIRSTDRFCSTIFSFAFLVIFYFVVSILLVLGLAGLALAIRPLFPNWSLQRLSLVLLSILLLPSTLAGLADRRLGKSGEEIPPGKKRWLGGMIRLYQHLMLYRFFASMYLTFTTNLRKKTIYPIFLLVFAGLMAGLFLDLRLLKDDQELLRSFPFYPSHGGAQEARFQHYESLRPPGPRYGRLPSIDSDVVEGPYVRLFLPYVPSRHNDLLGERCPELEPWPGRWERSDGQPEEQWLDETMACVAGLWEIHLDGAPLAEPEMVFYRHPDTRARGLLVHLDVRTLAPGRHLLELTQAQSEEEALEGEGPRLYQIPFWV